MKLYFESNKQAPLTEGKLFNSLIKLGFEKSVAFGGIKNKNVLSLIDREIIEPLKTFIKNKWVNSDLLDRYISKFDVYFDEDSSATKDFVFAFTFTKDKDYVDSFYESFKESKVVQQLGLTSFTFYKNKGLKDTYYICFNLTTKRQKELLEMISNLER